LEDDFFSCYLQPLQAEKKSATEKNKHSMSEFLAVSQTSS
jgi:hypothetical protein